MISCEKNVKINLDKLVFKQSFNLFAIFFFYLWGVLCDVVVLFIYLFFYFKIVFYCFTPKHLYSPFSVYQCVLLFISLQWVFKGRKFNSKRQFTSEVYDSDFIIFCNTDTLISTLHTYWLHSGSGNDLYSPWR